MEVEMIIALAVVFAAITRLMGAVDVLPCYTAAGRRYSWYLFGTCR